MSKSREALEAWERTITDHRAADICTVTVDAFLAGWAARGSANLKALPTDLLYNDQWNDGRSKGVAECRRAIASLDEHPPERHAPAPDGTDNPGATE